MKKTIIIAALATFNYVNAQTGSSTYAVNMKTAKENAYAYFSKFENTDVTVNSKALKNFSSHYASATNVQWSNLEKNGSVCHFYLKGILNKAFYNSAGVWTGTITTYEEVLLPDNIKAIVDANYPEYVISLVNEINKPHYQSVFVIELQSLKFIKEIRITQDGELDVMQEFEKQNPK